VAKLTENQKSLITIAVGVVLAIGFGVLIYLDLDEKKAVEEATEAKRAEKARNDAEIQKIPGLEKRLVAFKKIVTDNAQILPTEDDIHAFLRDISNLEKDIGFNLRVVPTYKPEDYKQVSSITRIPLKLQITSSTRSFLRFLNQLENRERLVSVSDFRVNPSPDEPKLGQEVEHEISMSFELYRYNPRAGQQGKFPITDAQFEQLLGTKDVRDILAAKGKPANLERYQLLAGRDNRRDPFLDPRRRTDKGPREGGRREGEEAQLEALRLKLERLRLELESYRNAEKDKDFLRIAAAKKNFLVAKEEMDRDIRKISQQQPEFTNRDLQERYLNDVRGPYGKLMTEAKDLVEGSGGGPIGVKITAEVAAGMRKDLELMIEQRRYQDAAEKWVGIDALLRDAAAAKSLEDSAKPHVDAMRKIGEEAKYLAILHARKIEVQGIVRMEKSSAVIVNNKTLFPGKMLDKDVRFVRVEQGPKGEGDRIVFSIDDHEVVYVQPKPALLQSERAVLTQD